MSESQDFKDLFESSIVTKEEVEKRYDKFVSLEAEDNAETLLQEIKNEFLSMAENGLVDSDTVVLYYGLAQPYFDIACTVTDERDRIKRSIIQDYVSATSPYYPKHHSGIYDPELSKKIDQFNPAMKTEYHIRPYPGYFYFLDLLKKSASKNDITITPMMYSQEHEKELSFPCTIIGNSHDFEFTLKCVFHRSGTNSSENIIPLDSFFSLCGTNYTITHDEYWNKKISQKSQSNQTNNTSDSSNNNTVWKGIVILALLFIGPIIAKSIDNPLLGLIIIGITIVLIILTLKYNPNSGE